MTRTVLFPVCNLLLSLGVLGSVAVESALCFCLQCRFRNTFNRANASRTFLWLIKMSLLIAKNMKTKCGLGVHAKSIFLFNRSNISKLGTRNIFNGLAHSQGTA